MELRIAHLYPDLMNTYGDQGNIIALTQRCLWRDISVTITPCSVGDKIDPSYFDLYFFGGGQDWQQSVVSKDLQGQKTEALLEAKKNQAVFLTICGGYQLLGRYYEPFDGPKLSGVGVIDCYTKASHKRMIGNLVIDIDSSVLDSNSMHPITAPGHPQPAIASPEPTNLLTLVGFENHSGQTFLGSHARPLGKTVVGFGNNGEDGTEGAIDGTAFGCYLHGSLLPKNPHFADYLISLALNRRYHKITLTPLHDFLELTAHEKAIARAKSTK